MRYVVLFAALFWAFLLAIWLVPSFAADKPVCLEDVNKVPKGAIIVMTNDPSCKSGLVWTLPKKK